MRRLWYAPAVGVLALAGVLAAGDIRVEENPVPANSFAVAAIDTAAGDTVLWEVSPEPTKLKEVPGDKAAAVHFSGPPGKYLVTATVVNFEAKAVARKRQTVVIGPAPDPNPRPGPQPDPPTPGPPTAAKRFVVVEDSAKPGPWRGDVLGSPKVAAMYQALGLSHRLIDAGADGDDPAATAYKGLAAGKALPWIWLLDAAGKVLRDQACPTDPDAFVALFDAHPGVRARGAIMARPKLKWKLFGENPSVPLIPRERWKPVDLGTFLPPVHDQNGVGQCASSSACAVWETCRAQAGLPYVYASAGDLYSRVNGGRDTGSSPEDNLAELLANGVAPASLVPYVWDGRRATSAEVVAARKPNRLAEAYLCDSFDALASAVQQGFVAQVAIWWYDNFTPDASGVLPRAGRGDRGGHALCAYGLCRLADGTWALLVRNSWGPAWGKGGNCAVPEALFRDANEFGNVWACRSVVQTRTDFPVPRVALRDRAADPLRAPFAEAQASLAP